MNGFDQGGSGAAAAEVRTPLPRSIAEVLARASARTPHDVMGFEICDYLEVLPFEPVNAAGFLKDGAEPDGWPGPKTVEQVSDEAKGYLPFWLEKIEDERGLSVIRATSHFIAWKWLLGHADADTFPGAPNGGDGGYYQKDAYNYIARQVETGEWDRLTASALSAAPHPHDDAVAEAA